MNVQSVIVHHPANGNLLTTQAESDKQTAIFQATLDLIAERGFHDTPMSLITKRSGVSTGIIYHYFDNKDDLIQQLYQRIKKRYAQALMAGEVTTLPYPDHLVRLWRNAYGYYIHHPKEAAFLEQYENSPYGHDFDFDADTNPDYAAMAGMIMGDVEAGHIRPMPLEVMYEMTLGVAAGLAKRSISSGVRLDAEMLDWIARALCRALRP
jgi:AcrR family transcriptional regulator